MTRAGERIRAGLAGVLALASIAGFFLMGCSKPARDDGLPTTGPGSQVFFVAPDGRDTWSGTRPDRNWRRSDGPFASVQKAVEAARAHKRAQPAAVITVVLRGGIYPLKAPVKLQPPDSGLTLMAYPGETPVLSAGVRISGWKEQQSEGQRVWVADLADARLGSWVFHQLWVNDRRAVRARHPDNGYLEVAELPDQTQKWTDGHTRFRYAGEDLRNWVGITNAEVVVMDRWVESRLPIVKVEEASRTVSFSLKSVFQLTPKDPYYVEGARAHLNTPGEWCLEAGRVYYLPEAGETLDRAEIFAPRQPQVLIFEGKPEQGQGVEKVTLSGLTFSHTEWYYSSNQVSDSLWPGPRRGIGGFGQAAVGVPAAVEGQGLLLGSITNCQFRHLGGYALELGRGCVSNRVSYCVMEDLGAGGVKIGDVEIRARETEIASGNELSDCLIRDGGKMFHSAVGVWVGQSPSNRLVHNEIHDFYYTGISLGWTWGYGPALATNTLVSGNHVHHLGQRSNSDGPILSDMAGIYTLGLQAGTRIVANLWHDIAGLRYGGWGIYFDEGTSQILAASNLVYRTTHGGFHQHYGRSNVVVNNIFAFARDYQVQRTRADPHLSFRFQTNIVYFDTGNLLGGDWRGTNYIMDHNLYFDLRPDRRADTWNVGHESLAQWRARGNDRHTLITNPRFEPGQLERFRLQPDSPAFQMGFKPFDVRGAGVRPKK